MLTRSEVVDWMAGLDEVVSRLAPRFMRSEPVRRVGAYLRGLLAPVERKNGWQLAEAVGDRTPDGMQDFLSRMNWDADAVRDDLQSYVVEQLGDEGAVLVLDETGFLKKGTKSAGVGRQYSGTAGRIENSQVGVFLGYASRHGHALLDRALYLPRDWAGDAARRREARIPPEVVFTTKPKQGLAMLEHARRAGVPFAWIAGDSVYGCDHRLRRWAERHRRGYVFTVTSGQQLARRPVTALIKTVSPKEWQRLSAGDGAKGPRLYDWLLKPYKGGAEGFECALLVRRSIDDPQALTFYLTHAPKATRLADLVRVAGSRWTIECLFEQAKGEVGLDQYEVRSWVGWHRHITLSMFALAYMAAVRKGAIGGCRPDGPGGGPVAAHRSGGPPSALEARRRPAPQPLRRVALVTMAPTPPATRPPRPLAATNQAV